MKLLLGKHELAYVNVMSYSIEYLTTQIELLLPTFKSGTVHEVIDYFILRYDYCLAFEISITVQQLTFLTHPV